MKLALPKAALLAGALALSAGAIAVAAPPVAPDGRPKAERGPDGGRHGRHGRHDPARRADHLRAVLQLTSQQEPALQTFLASTSPKARGDWKRERRAPDAAPLTTPERLDRQAARMAERQQAFAQRAAATKAFYGQLTAPQRKAFDALHGRRDGPGRGGMRLRADLDGAPLAFGPDGGDDLAELWDELPEEADAAGA
ncbi:MAG: Spy/CpxP family protein refolding chaperone [Pseudomonadota bacterium]